MECLLFLYKAMFTLLFYKKETGSGVSSSSSFEFGLRIMVVPKWSRGKKLLEGLVLRRLLSPKRSIILVELKKKVFSLKYISP